MRQMLSVLSVLLVSVTVLFGGIGEMDPEYNYSEFLQEDIDYTLLLPKERPPGRDYLFRLLQGHLRKEYHYTSFSLQDSLLAASVSTHYSDDIEECKVGFSYSDDLRAFIDYYNWEHKMHMECLLVGFDNSLDLFEYKGSVLSWSNRFRYLYRYSKRESYYPGLASVRDITGSESLKDFNDFSVNGSIAYSLPEWSFQTSYQIPYQHDNSRYRYAFLISRHWSSILFGSGLSYSRTDENNIFPELFFRYRYSNSFIVNARFQELFYEYPAELFFRGNGFYWASVFPEDIEAVQPCLTRKLFLSGELRVSDSLHHLSITAEKAKSFHDYRWMNHYLHGDKLLFTILKREEARERIIVQYTGKYRNTGFLVNSIPTGRSCFEPLFSVGAEQKLTYDVFHDFVFRIVYHHEEQIALPDYDWLGTINPVYGTGTKMSKENYFTVGLKHRYTKIKNLTIESGFTYSALDVKESAIDIRPDFFVRLSYGTMRNESLY